MRHVIQHPLTQEQAKQAIASAYADYAQRFASYSPTLHWQSETSASVGFRAKGVSLTGRIELEPGCVAIEIDVPFLLKPFAGKATAIIEREMRHWIDKAQAGA